MMLIVQINILKYKIEASKNTVEEAGERERDKESILRE
jgi:hypothetical protein